MRTVRPTWILVALAAVVLTAGPAQAGGPTSVLLVSPGSGATAALYTTDPDYRELSELVGSDEGAYGTPERGYLASDPVAHAQGPYVTVTWLIHDVHVWRVDRIYYQAGGGPWIFTEQETDRKLSPVGWQQSPEPARLDALLDRLGLFATGTDMSVASRLASAEPPAAVPDEAGSGAGSGSGVAGWWWAAGGLLVGIAGTVAATQVSPLGRSPAGTRQPRQQLIDL